MLIHLHILLESQIKSMCEGNSYSFDLLNVLRVQSFEWRSCLFIWNYKELRNNFGFSIVFLETSDINSTKINENNIRFEFLLKHRIQFIDFNNKDTNIIVE